MLCLVADAVVELDCLPPLSFLARHPARATPMAAVVAHHIHALASFGNANSISGSHTRAHSPHSMRCGPFPCIAFISAFQSLAVMLHLYVYVSLSAVGFRLLFIGSSPFSSPWSPPFSLLSPLPPPTVALFGSLLGSLLRASWLEGGGRGQSAASRGLGARRSVAARASGARRMAVAAASASGSAAAGRGRAGVSPAPASCAWPPAGRRGG